MITIQDRDTFSSHVIAQHDDEDYNESGYVAVVYGNWAALSRYDHCSCYDTWDDLTSVGYSGEQPQAARWDWQGTPSKLLELAQNKLDPALPGRFANEQDYDYDHLLEVYKQIIEYFTKHPEAIQ